MKYKSGYKYQLAEMEEFKIDFHPYENIIDGLFIQLYPDGTLRVGSGYAWDGPSGPAIDTKNFMRGSLVHDALYQLIREGHLPETYRQRADEVLREVCREDGMSWIRAWWVYHALKVFGGPAADPKNKRKVHIAP